MRALSFAAALFWLIGIGWPDSAYAGFVPSPPAVQQTGNVTLNHVVTWAADGSIQDGGIAASPCSAFGTTAGTCIQGAGDAGTPSAIVLTNATGTATGLTAGNASAAPAGTLTGATLAAGVTASSITSVGATLKIGSGGSSADPLDIHLATNVNFFVRNSGGVQIGSVDDPFSTFGTLSLGGPVAFSSIGTDAALTDTTACIVTSTNVIAKGSGTLGICLGTSSARYKTGIANLSPGLPEILALSPKSFYLDKAHGNPTKQMYGFLAEDVVKVLPHLVENDKEGRPNTADYLGMVPVIVKAIHQITFWLALMVVWNIILTVLILRRRH